MANLDKQEIREVEGILGYRFRKKSLLQEAMTHRSIYYATDEEAPPPRSRENSLRSLGHKFLEENIENLVLRNDKGPFVPGYHRLNRVKCANTGRWKLARMFVDSGLADYLIHSLPALQGQIEHMRDNEEEYPIEYSGDESCEGKCQPPKALANKMKALLGAVYIDGGEDAALEVFKRHAFPLVNLATLKGW